jgi:thiamine kinase-like enzyme
MRTLSPSDIGFINAIKTPYNQWVFLDFEYAGWDDPAKMIADAIHHPGIPIPETLHQIFINDTLSWLEDSENIALRIKNIFPLVGLKWCLIILKKFNVIANKNKKFLDIKGNKETILKNYFKKAELKLEQIKRYVD